MAFTLQDILGLNQELLALAEDVGNAALEKSTDLAGCGAMFLARGAQCVHSASILAQEGLNGDAMSVARTVTEMSIDYPYIALDPSVRLKRFRDWDYIAKYRLAEATEELHGGAMDPEVMRKLKELHDKALIEHYPRRRNRRPGNWADVPIRERAILVDESSSTPIERKRMRKRMYTLPYADMCDASHSCYGTLWYVRDKDQELVFGRMTPNPKPADLAFTAMLILTGDVIDVNGLDASLGERVSALCLLRQADAIPQRA